MLSLIPNIFDPYTLFSEIEDEEAQGTKYFFKGMICYSVGHYFTYFRDFDSQYASRSWKKYDDKHIKDEEYNDWDLVLKTCIEGRERPILLLFEELRTNDAKNLAVNKHYLNNLIGDKEWDELFKYAKRRDKERDELAKETEADRIAAQKWEQQFERE